LRLVPGNSNYLLIQFSIRSDLGTSEENLTLNLRKTFDQCSIRSFGSAFLDPQITCYTRRFSPHLCSANYLLQHPHIRILSLANTDHSIRYYKRNNIV